MDASTLLAYAFLIGLAWLVQFGFFKLMRSRHIWLVALGWVILGLMIAWAVVLYQSWQAATWDIDRAFGSVATLAQILYVAGGLVGIWRGLRARSARNQHMTRGPSP